MCHALNMAGANVLSVGGNLQMLARNSKAVESFIAVVGPVCQCEKDSKICVAICPDPESFCRSADSVLNNFLSV